MRKNSSALKNQGTLQVFLITFTKQITSTLFCHEHARALTLLNPALRYQKTSQLIAIT